MNKRTHIHTCDFLQVKHGKEDSDFKQIINIHVSLLTCILTSFLFGKQTETTTIGFHWCSG